MCCIKTRLAGPKNLAFCPPLTSSRQSNRLERLGRNVKRKDLQKCYQMYYISLCTLKIGGFGMSKILCKILCVILLFCMVGFFEMHRCLSHTHLISCGCDKLDPYATTSILMQRPYATSLFFNCVSKRWCVCIWVGLYLSGHVSGLVCVYLGRFVSIWVGLRADASGVRSLRRVVV